MSYIVILEYVSAGYTGVRFYLDYNNKSQFEDLNPQLKDGRIHVVVEDVSESYAKDYVSLTPEVCYLTAAVEEMCQTKDGSVDTKMVQYSLSKAKSFISANREHRLKNGIVTSNSPFPFVSVRNDISDKDMLFSFIQTYFYNLDGSVGDLEEAFDAIEQAIYGFSSF